MSAAKVLLTQAIVLSGRLSTSSIRRINWKCSCVMENAFSVCTVRFASAQMSKVLTCNGREDARFLYKRFPAEVRNEPEVSASFQLLQRLWNKDYQVFGCVIISQHMSRAIATILSGHAGSQALCAMLACAHSDGSEVLSAVCATPHGQVTTTHQHPETLQRACRC